MYRAVREIMAAAPGGEPGLLRLRLDGPRELLVARLAQLHLAQLAQLLGAHLAQLPPPRREALRGLASGGLAVVAAARLGERAERKKIAHGWPESWAKCRPSSDGDSRSKSGPHRAVRASPVTTHLNKTSW
jgi:hypothetical protein